MDEILIGRFLRDATCKPIIWGRTDCAMIAAGVWSMVTGYDPMEGLHGAYSTRWQYMQIAMKEGGLQAMARVRMDHPTAGPFKGDGIGFLSHRARKLFAVAVGGVWVAPAKEGGLVNVSDGQILEAWGW